jgi:hypothetical protein
MGRDDDMTNGTRHLETLDREIVHLEHELVELSGNRAA